MFDGKEDTIWLSSLVSLSNSSIYLYVYYSLGKSGYLEKDGITFGIYEKLDGNFIAQLKEKTTDELDTKDFTWIENNFTLISSTTDSLNILINEMQKWLLKLPAKKTDKDVIIANFNDMIISKYKFIEQQN